MKERLSSGSRGISTPPYFITFLSYFSRYINRRIYTTAISVGQEDSPDFSLCVSRSFRGITFCFEEIRYLDLEHSETSTIIFCKTNLTSESRHSLLHLHNPYDMPNLNDNILPVFPEPDPRITVTRKSIVDESIEISFRIVHSMSVSVDSVYSALHSCISTGRYLNPSEILV